MGKEINLFDYFFVLKKRRFLLFYLPCFSAFLAIIISFQLTPVYRATTSLFVVSDTGAGIVALLPSGVAPTGLLGSIFGSTQSDYLISLLQSQTAARKVIRKLNLDKNEEFVGKDKKARVSMQELTKRFLKMTKVKKNRMTGKVTITVEGKNPELIANIANTLVQEAKAMVITKADRNLHFLKEQVKKMEKRVRELEEELKAFQEKHKKLSLSADIEEQIKLIAKLKAEEIESQIKLSDVNARLKTAGALTMLAQLRVEKEALEKSVSRLRREIAQQEAKLSVLPGQNLEFTRLTRNLKIAATLYESLIRDYSIARFKREGEVVVFQVVDRAEAPEEPFKPTKRLNVLITFFAFLVFALFLAFFLEFIDNERKRWEEHQKSSS